MDRRAYLNRLAQELAKWVPQQERQNMLRYYEEYLDEAGPYQEQAVIAGLGDPAKLARALAEEAGFVPRRRRSAGLVVLAIMAVPIVVVMLVMGARIAFVMNLPAIGNSVVSIDEVTNTAEMFDYGEDWWTKTGQVTSNPIAGLSEGADITVELPLGNVMVCTGPVEQVCVNQSGLPGYEVVWRVKDNRLVVEAEEYATGFSKILLAEVTIIIPENWRLGRVRIDTELGTVNLQRVWANKLYVKTELGDILAEGTTAGSLKAESDLGDVTVTGELPLDSELKTEMGGIVIAANCTPGECSYKLESGLGQVYVDGWECGRESSHTVEGICHINGETGWGDIHLDFFGGGMGVND